MKADIKSDAKKKIKLRRFCDKIVTNEATSEDYKMDHISGEEYSNVPIYLFIIFLDNVYLMIEETKKEE